MGEGGGLVFCPFIFLVGFGGFVSNSCSSVL